MIYWQKSALNRFNFRTLSLTGHFSALITWHKKMQASTSFTSVSTCCSLSASTSSFQSEKPDNFPKRIANTILFKWTHGKLRWKHAMKKIYSRKYKVKSAEECYQLEFEGAILRNSILYDCLSNIGPISFSKIPRTYGLEDLPDRLLLRIMQMAEDPRPLTSICPRFTRLLERNIGSFERVQLHREVVYRYDRLRKTTKVFVLKEGRSIRTPEREADNLTEVFGKSPVKLICKMTFESEVPVHEHVPELLDLRQKGVLVVTNLVFTGGALSTQTHLRGADLSQFSQASFLGFIRSLLPQLKSLSLFTSQHFSYSVNLLELVRDLEFIGIMYSRLPCFVLTVEDVKQVIKFWLSAKNRQTATIYCRLTPDSDPTDFEEMDKKKCVLVSTGENGVIAGILCLSTNGNSLNFDVFCSSTRR
ncbi:hypothetical protein L596_029382 [Steinernema carpocapsae]|uniref:F-box domain-containing protein n=1 Tax=Steinernema carpocapsae TaxID=34508 RepID=A0A4V5ZXH4_STECR|nr:hypothetical protein L596_029382 [Steinernema carpocapsae]